MEVGWLSPSGEIVSCEGYAHVDKARKICMDLHILKENETPDETLINNGWIRISRVTYGDVGLMIWMAPHRLSLYQAEFLTQFASDHLNEFNSITRTMLKEYGLIW